MSLNSRESDDGSPISKKIQYKDGHSAMFIAKDNNMQVKSSGLSKVFIQD